MKKKLTGNYHLLFLASMFAFAPVSCSAEKLPAYILGAEEQTGNDAGSNKSTAYFDFFTYKGNDAVYTNNPLTTPGAFYTNILPGFYSDPSICSNGKGDYFLVTSSFCYFPGVPIFHSTDLVNWKQLGHVLSRPSQLIKIDGKPIQDGIYAPAIEYNPYNETYYMITTNINAGNFYVTTRTPMDASSWSEPVYIDGLMGCIDPSFFFEGDKAYIVYNDGPDTEAYSGHRTIRLREFDVATGKVINPAGRGKILVDKGTVKPGNETPIWIEGPHLYKIEGTYYLMCAEGGTGPWHSEVVYRSDRPTEGFEPWDQNPILTQRRLDATQPDRLNPVTTTGHADMVQTVEGDWWAVFLGCRPIPGTSVNKRYENLGRETFLMPVKWTEDGWPYIQTGEFSAPIAPVQERPFATRGNDVTFGNFEKRADFATQTLGVEWMTLRAPATEYYSLTEKEGYLALKCAEVSSREKLTPAYIGRRMQHHAYTCETELTLNAKDGQDRAGLLLFQDDNHQYFLSVNKSGKKMRIALEKTNATKVNNTWANASVTTIGEQLVDDGGKPIGLKVESKGLTYEFYYKLSNGSWQKLCGDVDAYHLSVANCGGFTGATIGMYATRKL